MTYTNTRSVRIEWGDCDPAGIIFFPNYFRIFDHSTAMLFESALGMTKFEMFKNLEFEGWPLIKTQARFLKPTRFGDLVEIATSISFGNASFKIEHRLTKNGELAVEAFETRVWVTQDPDEPLRIKAEPIPREVIEKFQVA